MKIVAAATLALLFYVGVASTASAQSTVPNTPNATAPSASTQRPAARPNRSVEITEVRPGIWVSGTPTKPIISGNMPIYPEAYDNMPARLP